MFSDEPVAVQIDDYFIIERGGITFMARHPLLVDLACDLARGLPPDIPLRGTVAVGIHNFRPRNIKGPLIGIQTEHYLDANRQEMFRTVSNWKKKKFLWRFDYILDISLHNPYAYKFFWPRKHKKLFFGPYIFPASPVRRSKQGSGVAFIGAINERRKQILSSLNDVTIIAPNTWGMDLHRILQDSEAVLNIHYIDSVVTEAPRLLKAYLAGKPVVSEALAEPVEMGRHAIPLGEDYDAARLDAVFDAFDHEIARKFRFVDFLEKTLA
ncbi:hypothetical protein [Paracoccus solventivorans]|nr:hypothetical protein [Paracoccus solventivorans]